jgi:oligopeptide transport system substrate-binding protein
VYFIGIGPGHPVTASQEAVFALSRGLNRSELPQALGVPHRPADSYCPPEVMKKRQPARNAPVGKPFSFEKQPPLTLRYFNRPAMKLLAEWIQAQWKKNLGLRVQLEGQETKTYWSELGRNPSALFLNSKGTSYPDPDAFFRLFEPDSEQNLGRWKSAEYVNLIARARKVPHRPERDVFYAKAESLLLHGDGTGTPALIPLYWRSTQYLIKPFVHDVVINPLTSVYFDKIKYTEN